jgi:hypothetical protein
MLTQAIVTAALAQTLTEPNPHTKISSPHAKSLPTARMKSCSLYGAGFVNVRSTDACIKVGGYVSTIGQPLTFLNASTDAELDAALAALRQQRVTAMLLLGNPFFDTNRNKIIAFAAQQKLPALYLFREYVWWTVG